MYERTYGNKYDENLTTTQIAAKVREEIKTAVKAGGLPAGKYSVRKTHHNYISIHFAPEGNVFDPRYLRDTEYLMGPSQVVGDKYLRPSRYLPNVSAAVEKITTMLAAYNHDGSEIQSDYFDVKFYSNVTVDADYTEARAALLAADADLAQAAQDYAGEAALALSEEAISNVIPLRASVAVVEESDQVRFMSERGLA